MRKTVKKTTFSLILALAMAMGLLTGCAGSTPASDASAGAHSASESVSAPAEGNGDVAAASEMAPAVELNLEGLTPVPASELNEGEWPIEVECSSSMFRITDCTLTVSEGTMTAHMTMGGTGYLWLYPGTGEEAAAADESAYLPVEEDAEGVHHFSFPVEALDQAVPCAAYSKRKEKWYDRTLVFRSGSLPVEAMKNAPAGELPELEDGSYTVEVSLSGGSGRASVDSPATLTVEDGVCTAHIVWSSPNYDYMLTADGVRLEPVNTEGNSAFDVPVTSFDSPMKVQADTTAMSQPHLIDYTLLFTSASIQPKE